MKGPAIISTNLLILPVPLVLMLATTACFTIVSENSRPSAPSLESTPEVSEVTGDSLMSETPLYEFDSGDAYMLELVADPSEAAEFVLYPPPNRLGTYPAGTAVTIDVLPSQGWEIEQWVGPVYAISSDGARVNMDRDQTVLVRMVQSGVVTFPLVTFQPVPTTH